MRAMGLLDATENAKAGNVTRASESIPTPQPGPLLMFQHELVIVQSPVRGRMSGFSAPKDTRLIGPQLILQLVCRSKDGTVLVLPDTSRLLTKVVLLEDDVPAKLNPSPNRAKGHDSNLLGNPVACCRVLRGLDGEMGMYFIFPDLGIRSPGRYRLQCFCMEIDLESACFPVTATTTTAQFRVYAPKSFPGPLGNYLENRHVHDYPTFLETRCQFPHC
ncbi:velvet factor-domain-containing protein [Gorgonomyces haynaldii]|nr:velvet factor-domain-containing protein [Gorgonomyces haynaldii]